MIIKFENHKYFTDNECHKMYLTYLNTNDFDDYETLIAMIKNKPYIFDNYPNNYPNNNPIIMWATYKDDFDIVKTLYESGVDIDKKNKAGDNALFWAFDDASFKLIKYIINISRCDNINNNGENFIEYMNNVDNRFIETKRHKKLKKKIINYLIEEQPLKYKNILKTKKIKKFNI